MSSPLDQHSPCPGGTGKKIRFCCRDLLPELERIARSMEGEQWHASLEHIERTQERYPDRACLFSLKGEALFRLDRRDEAKANAEAFVARHPENPVAQAEMAFIVASEADASRCRAAIGPALKALRLCRDEATRDQIQRHVLYIFLRLVRFGFSPAARALLDSWAGDEATLSFDANAPGPLWYREPRPLAPCPEDFPWKAHFDQALQHARTLYWFEAEHEFAELAQRASDVPAVWQNLMILRSWLADVTGSAEAARRCAALLASDDDAAELEAYAAYSTGEMLGDKIRVPRVQYPVTDAKALQKAIERDASITALEVTYRDKGEEDLNKCEHWYGLVGPPVPPTGVPDWACVLGLVEAKGDEPAYLKVIPFMPECLTDAQRRVEALAGGALGPSQPMDDGEERSATEAFLRNAAFLGMGAPPQWHAVLTQRCQTFVRERWPKIPLGLLGGKTFEEASADPGSRRRALAAILLLEDYVRSAGMAVDGDAVRMLLGLGPPEPINLDLTPLDTVPVARLHLVPVENLSGPQLVAAFERALRFGATAALARLGPALAHDDSVPWNPTRVEAAVVALQREPNYARVVALCQKWRQDARLVPGACAKFDIQEAWARFFRGEFREMMELLKHLTSQHHEEPGVAEAVEALHASARALVGQLSLLAKRQAEPSIVAPDGGQPGKLWTPESARQPGTKPTLWTPGNP